MRVGVLGLGSIGLRHARNLVGLGSDVAGFDPDEARRGMLAEVGGRAAPARDSLLASIDAVVVATPSQFHGQDLREALSRGLHVFIEKPLAHATEGLADLLRTADKAGRVVFPALNLRYHPVVSTARDVIRSGRLGRPLWARFLATSYLPSWRPGTDYRQNYTANPKTGGVLFDDIHEFDLANHLLGPAVPVAAAARRTGELDIAAEDSADVILRHESGVQSALHCDYSTKVRQRQCEVALQDGLLRLDLIARELQEIHPDGSAKKQVMEGTVSDDYVAEMRDFLACIRRESSPRCSPAEAMAVLGQVVQARQMAGLPQ